MATSKQDAGTPGRIDPVRAIVSVREREDGRNRDRRFQRDLGDMLTRRADELSNMVRDRRNISERPEHCGECTIVPAVIILASQSEIERIKAWIIEWVRQDTIHNGGGNA